MTSLSLVKSANFTSPSMKMQFRKSEISTILTETHIKVYRKISSSMLQMKV